MSDGVSNFRVVAQDDHGDPVHCSYCTRDVKYVAVLPLTDRPELEKWIRAADGEELWVGLCAYCVLDMANAFAHAEATPP